MNVFTVSDKLILGRETEHGVTTIQFPIAKWIERYGSGGTFYLWNKRSQDSAAYPVTITSDTEYVYWTPTATDLAYNGYGEAQLDYTFGTSGTSTYKKACSEIFTTRVERSVEAGSTTPAAYTAWVTQVENYATRAETAAEEAEEAAEEAEVSASEAAASAEEAAEIAETLSIKGVPSGGTAGQVLAKKSGTNYDTEWQDASGGTWGSITGTLSNQTDLNTVLTSHSTEIANKVDKVTGKGLSTNDYTTAEKTKLDGIAAGAEVNVNADWEAESGDAQILNKPTIPSEVTESTVSGWGFTKNTGTVSSLSDLSITATATELNYTDGVTANIQTQLDTASAQIANIEDLGLSVVNGQINITYTED